MMSSTSGVDHVVRFCNHFSYLNSAGRQIILVAIEVMALNEWINADESAAEMLRRVLADRPFLLLPPLHRVPLRVGNVVELVGSSASSKTQILMQVIVKCILPNDWNGVHYGGLERAVMFIDLDCRFEILRLCQILRLQILEANGALGSTNENDGEQKPRVSTVDELHDLCMRRFLYTRCYDSFNLLSILKTLHYQLQKNKECGADVHVLMIDSIGAFHWIDRISSNRKGLSLHIVFEAIVQEMKRLLLLHPMLVLVTKSTILGHKSTNLIKRNVSSSESSDLRNAKNMNQQPLPQEFMPLVWQSFVSHRVLLRASDDHICTHGWKHLVYTSEWVEPALGMVDEFIVRDVRHYLRLQRGKTKEGLDEVLSNVVGESFDVQGGVFTVGGS